MKMWARSRMLMVYHLIVDVRHRSETLSRLTARGVAPQNIPLRPGGLSSESTLRGLVEDQASLQAVVGTRRHHGSIMDMDINLDGDSSHSMVP